MRTAIPRRARSTARLRQTGPAPATRTWVSLEPRSSFAELGYAGTTLRSVARQADVDPALVNYYFKTKSGLLEAALVPPEGWTTSLAEAAAAPIEERGAALVRTFIAAWED